MRPTFDLRHDNGPFDILGDIHGCVDELSSLLTKLGYKETGIGFIPPPGRKLIFLGDLNDRGPDSVAPFMLAMEMVERGYAYYTPGNHCAKLLKYLDGRRVQLAHGLADTVAQLHRREAADPGFSGRLRYFLAAAHPYLWLAGGTLVVAHAGIKSHMIGRDDDRIRAMCLYGDTTGERNPDGTPVRLDWAQHYQGRPAIIYGHTPTPGPTWVNNTINIDQGCVFGGWLTALRWPEREVVQVRALQPYFTERTPAFITL